MSPVLFPVLPPYCPLSALLAVAEAIKIREQVVPRAAEAEKNRRQLAPRVAEAGTRMVQVAPRQNPGNRPKNKNPKVAEVGTRMVQVAPQQSPRKKPKNKNPKAVELSPFHAVRMICTARSLIEIRKK